MGRPRKPRQMKWHVYLARRGITAGALIAALGIKTHVKLEEWCESNNIEAPTGYETRAFFRTKKVLKKPETPVDDIIVLPPIQPVTPIEDNISLKKTKKSTKASNPVKD